MSSHVHREFLFAALGVVFALPAQGVRLVRVPERLVLPAPSGSNLMLEVEVVGGADRIWLARGELDDSGVPLAAVGEGRYQLNLADARVVGLVRAGEADGAFHVRARVGDRVVAGPPIAWSRGDAPVARARCHVKGGGEPATVVGLDGEHWLDVARTDRLEVHGVAAPLARVKLVAGTTDVLLPWRGGEQGFALDLNEGLRTALQQAAACTLDVRAGDDVAQFAFRIVPDRIDAAANEPFVVMQRRAAFVPGTRQWLEVRIDDITMGQVLLTVVDATGRDVVAARHVADHDDVPFRLGTDDYVLYVDRLVNKLVADDWAELSVHPAAGFRPDVLARLIRRVEAATGVVFVREGTDHGPAMAAQLLRARLASVRGPAPTPQEFLELCSKSSRTGEPYHVRKADGTVQPARDWLLEQLAAVEHEVAPVQGEPKK